MFCVCVQALDWIQDTGEVYLATHTSPGGSSEETQQLLNDCHHFRLSAKVTPAPRTSWGWTSEKVNHEILQLKKLRLQVLGNVYYQFHY